MDEKTKTEIAFKMLTASLEMRGAIYTLQQRCIENEKKMELMTNGIMNELNTLKIKSNEHEAVLEKERKRAELAEKNAYMWLRCSRCLCFVVILLITLTFIFWKACIEAVQYHYNIQV